MSQLPITIVGHLTQEPILVQISDTQVKTTMRVASSRTYSTANDEGKNEWKATDTLYQDVECWGPLAEHTRLCLKKGDPVVVVGSLNTNEYQDREGNNRSRTIVRATHVALDLNRHILRHRKVDPAELGLPEPEKGEVPVDKDLVKERAKAAADSPADAKAAKLAAVGPGF